MMRLFPGFLPFWLIGVAASCTSVPDEEPDALLQQGRTLYEAGKYKHATKYFKAIESRHEESEEREEALFLNAESQRHLRNTTRAFTLYQKFVERYPNSRFSIGVATGEYRLGVDTLDGKSKGFLFFGTDRGYGIRVLEHMQIHFRNHSPADDALMRIADFHIEHRDYEEATDVLSRLLSQYPRSKWHVRARFQFARALWLMSEGPDYDERILERSRRGFEDFLGTIRLRGREEEFPEQMKAAEEMIQTINERLAHKHYRIGRFYERTEHPESAVFHYEYCWKTYPGTEYAKRSSERLESLRKELKAAADEPASAGKAEAS